MDLHIKAQNNARIIRETYLISFSFEDVTCTPPPPNFSTDLAFFRDWFFAIGGAVAPPPRPPLGYATGVHVTVATLLQIRRHNKAIQNRTWYFYT
jgi:hypothetical protein